MTSPRIEPITPDNFETALAVAVREDQAHLVEPVVKSLAEASMFPGVAWTRLITDGDEAVGFLMAFFDIDWRGDGSGDLRSGLWRLNIDGGVQGRGYGRFAVEQVCAEIRRRGGSRFFVTWRPGPDGPEEFYRRLGVTLTGETSGGDVVGVLEL